VIDDTGATVQGESYWLVRFVFLRMLGAIYLIAFLVAVSQGPGLLGSDGLLPIRQFLGEVGRYYDGTASRLLAVPTVFWLDASDRAMQLVGYAGVGLSVLVVAGATNAVVMAALWILYMSFVRAGQLFYGYGWEMLLLEAGFLAIFTCPVRSFVPFPKGVPMPRPMAWLLRWLVFRVMFGAGLIKLRGDPCWRDLTCLAYHYQTQPIPNPVSWYLHHAPLWFHRLGVAWNHFVELVAPLLLFAPRRLRLFGALQIVAFQLVLIASGNLSFLNWLTIAVTIGAFDDRALARVLPRRLRARASSAAGVTPRSRAHLYVVYALCVLVGLLSVQPTLNLLGRRQLMNASFDPLGLVNTYGAFGSVGRKRFEIVLEGTYDDPDAPHAKWLEYEFRCKPGDVARRPCVVSPYHERIDWQMWFAAMSDINRQPWLIHLVYKLLHGDPTALGLLDLPPDSPLASRPPRAIRAILYEYRFTDPGDPSGNWWVREPVRTYLPPVTADDQRLESYVEAHGWSR